jgi:hypothetical protein
VLLALMPLFLAGAFMLALVRMPIGETGPRDVSSPTQTPQL